MNLTNITDEFSLWNGAAVSKYLPKEGDVVYVPIAVFKNKPFPKQNLVDACFTLLCDCRRLQDSAEEVQPDRLYMDTIEYGTVWIYGTWNFQIVSQPIVSGVLKNK